MENVTMWARRVLSQRERYVIVDTETTGTSRRDQVIELGIIDLDGNTIMRQRIKPTVTIDPCAFMVHGITAHDLKDAPAWPTIEPEFRRAIQYKTMLMYNAAFDCRMIEQTYRAYWRRPPLLRAKCIMEPYTQFNGRITRLGGNHNAVGDCRAALAALERMANYG